MKRCDRLLCILLLLLATAGCDPDPYDPAGPFERAGETIDRGAEKAIDASKEAYDKTKAVVGGAVRGAKDALDHEQAPTPLDEEPKL